MPNPPSHPNAATTAFQDPVSGGGSNSPLAPGDLAFLDPPAEPGDLGKLGKYRVIKLLGQGGMGFVFAAQDTHLRRDIALKVMKPELAIDTQFRERFLQEARAAAQVQSEYVVTVYDFGVHGDAPFIAMQLLHGEALQERLQRDGPLPLDVAVAVLRQAAEGLAAAHRLNMTHRDIKPANLWLEADPATGAFRRVKILDFGLARLEDRDTKLTASGMIVGTPHYMAPEQASGLQVDARADIFSLGCVAYTALTGRLAFEGASTMAVLMSLANHTPTPLCVANLHVPAELSDLVGRMMAKNRDLRPASADEVVAALDGMRPEAPLPPAAGPARAEGGFFGRARPSDAVKTVPHPSRAAQATPAPWPAQTPKPGPVSAPFTLTATTMPSKMTIPVTPPAPPKKPAGGWVKYAAGAVVLAALAGGAAVFLGGGKPTAATGPDKAAVPPPTSAGGRPAVPFPGTGPVKVGLLYATAGEAADDDRPVAAATELAVKEAGTVLGRPLEAVMPDGLSDPDGFAKAAERLIADDRVAALFGGGPPAARAAVARVAAKYKVPLFSPGRSDGNETFEWVVTLGPVPNQSVLPAVDYLVHRRGKRNVFHVGSEDSYSRAAYKYIDAYMSKQRLPAGSPRLVGTAYLAADGHNVDEIADAVRKAKPDAIVNTITGPSKAKGALLDKLTAGSTVPVLSLGLTESERRSLAATGRPAEHLVAGVGFPPLAGGPLAPVQARFDALRTASDPMAAAYTAVKLWKKAVELARTDDRGTMMDKLGLVTEPAVAGPGYVKVDAATRCAFLPLRVGMVEPGGGVKVVYEVNRDDGIRPIPDLYTKDDKDWNGFLNGLTRSK